MADLSGSIVDGTSEADKINGTGGDDILKGRGKGDSIFGKAGDDFIKGGKGFDLCLGGKGDDIIEGNEGKDTLYGGRGSDMLYGGRGDDYLNGDYGADILWGGKGNDVFFMNRKTSGIDYDENPASDIIMDYEVGDVIRTDFDGTFELVQQGSDVLVYKDKGGPEDDILVATVLNTQVADITVEYVI